MDLRTLMGCLDPKNENAWKMLQQIVIPIARQIAKSSRGFPVACEEFPGWALTWLLEKRISKLNSDNPTDPLYKIFAKYESVEQVSPAWLEEVQKGLYQFLSKYAWTDYLRNEFPDLKSRTGGVQQDLNGGGQMQLSPRRVRIPISDERDDNDEYSYVATSTRNPAMGIEEKLDRQAELNRVLDTLEKLPDSGRITMKLRLYPMMAAIKNATDIFNDQDIEFIRTRQKRLPEEARLIDPAGSADTIRDQLTRILDEIDGDQIPYEVIGQILDCSPNTANVRVSRAHEQLRGKKF